MRVLVDHILAPERLSPWVSLSDLAPRSQEQTVRLAVISVLYMHCGCHPGTAVGSKAFPSNYTKVKDVVLRVLYQDDGRPLGVWLTIDLNFWKGYQFSSSYRLVPDASSKLIR